MRAIPSFPSGSTGPLRRHCRTGPRYHLRVSESSAWWAQPLNWAAWRQPTRVAGAWRRLAFMALLACTSSCGSDADKATSPRSQESVSDPTDFSRLGLPSLFAQQSAVGPNPALINALRTGQQEPLSQEGIRSVATRAADVAYIVPHEDGSSLCLFVTDGGASGGSCTKAEEFERRGLWVGTLKWTVLVVPEGTRLPELPSSWDLQSNGIAVTINGPELDKSVSIEDGSLVLVSGPR